MMKELKERSLIEDEIRASKNLIKQWNAKAASAGSAEEKSMFLSFAKEGEDHLAAHIAELKLVEEAEKKAVNKASGAGIAKSPAKTQQAKKAKPAETAQIAAPPEHELLN